MTLFGTPVRFVALMLSLVTTACASLPARDPTPRRATAGEVRQQLTVRGGGGPVDAKAEARVVEALKAEGASALVERQLAVLAAQGEVDLYRGNATRLLIDGPATFASMKAAIEGARHRVLLESYIFEDAGVAAQFGELLARKAAAGVKVALLYDAVGSFGSDEAFFDGLKRAGVSVCVFNPVNPLKRPGYWGINHRDHRKLLVADHTLAYTGGINISQVYSSGSAPGSRRKGSAPGGPSGGGLGSAAAAPAPGASGPDAKKDPRLVDGWRDTQIELRGPVVAALANGFARVWRSQGCEGALGDAPPPPANAGPRVVKLLETEPTDPSNRVYTSLLAAIDASQRSVHLTMAYFAPGADMVQALCDAARRGVDVALVLPGTSDFKLILHAGRSYYDQLLAAGVKVHEMEHAMMHAKTAVIDGVLSTVGSSNLDWRSFVDNSEINVLVLGDDFGRELEAVFARDVAVSRRIEPDAWAQRGLKARFMEGLGRLAERWL